MINSSNQKYVEPFQPKLGDELIPALKWEDRYKYLGVQTGREKLKSMKELEESMCTDAEKILNSPLSDWQKIDAINTFVVSKATYYLSTSVLNKTWAARIDSRVQKLVKKSMKLPKRTLGAFFHASKSHGGLGIASVEDNMDVARVTHALRCLTSPDKMVQDVARSQLTSVAKKRLKKADVQTTDIEHPLNSPSTPQEASRGDVTSLWSAVRKSLNRLSCKVRLEGAVVFLTHKELDVNAKDRRAVTNLLGNVKSNLRLSQLLDAKDQGCAFASASKDPTSNFWIQSGAFLSFAEYRFAIKARLNLLPTKVAVKRAGKPHLDPTCPKCKLQPESLGHILNTCTPNAGLMRERYNAILKRLVKATPTSTGDRFVEQKIPDSPSDL